MLACPSVDFFFLYKHCKVQKLAVKTHDKGGGEIHVCVHKYIHISLQIFWKHEIGRNGQCFVGCGDELRPRDREKECRAHKDNY